MTKKEAAKDVVRWFRRKTAFHEKKENEQNDCLKKKTGKRCFREGRDWPRHILLEKGQKSTLAPAHDRK